MQEFCQSKIYHCYLAISGHHSNDMSSVNTLHERKVCSIPYNMQNELHFISVYRVYSVSTDFFYVDM
jgi:hypothetical protein